MLPLVEIRIRESEIGFLVAEPILAIGRYSLNIERYQGLISYDKGIYYRLVIVVRFYNNKISAINSIL